MKTISLSRLLAVVLLMLVGCKEKSVEPTAGAIEPEPTISFTIVAEHPHDTKAFTQGLFVAGGDLYESTGEKGTSWLRRIDLKTGAVLKSASLNHGLFGEGSAYLNGRIYQLTWQAGQCFVYERESFQFIKKLAYEGEGWGLTTDGKLLIMSDGSATLRFIDPETFAVVKSLTVRGSQGTVRKLNELEFVDGSIYANVWQSDEIMKISPETGVVEARIDASALMQPRPADKMRAVLNGIAYDPKTKHFLLTGKLWPKIYEVKLNER